MTHSLKLRWDNTIGAIPTGSGNTIDGPTIAEVAATSMMLVVQACDEVLLHGAHAVHGGPASPRCVLWTVTFWLLWRLH